eukprot:5300928-Prymnesium_polylepis.2
MKPHETASKPDAGFKHPNTIAPRHRTAPHQPLPYSTSSRSLASRRALYRSPPARSSSTLSPLSSRVSCALALVTPSAEPSLAL